MAMSDQKRWHFETIAVHAASAVDRATGAVTSPIHLSTTFERAVDGTFPSGYAYIRNDNPNRRALEAGIAALEGGSVAVAFASGMAATQSVFQTLAPGDHVIIPLDAYFGTAKLLQEQFVPWGLDVSIVDMRDLQAVRAAMRDTTRIVWTETPSNPTISITDLAAISEVAKAGGAIMVVDNTWATPYLQRPFDHGAHVVMHSTTKYLSGHSDAMGGVVVMKDDDEFAATVRSIQARAGAVPSPFDSWLVMRGIRTLPWRMRGHCENAMKIATFLAAHPRVERVHYPGLKSDPGYAVAMKQMSSPGGMMSFVVPGGRDAAFALTSKLKLFTRATSLGGADSLIEHRASIEGEKTRAPEGLLRVSVGLEHADDLIADLDQALGG